MRHTLVTKMKELDEDGSGSISKAEMGAILQDPHLIEVLDQLVIDIPNFVAYLDMLYEKHHTDVKIAQVVELLLLLRGSNHCTIQSMIHDRCFSAWSFEKLLQ